ncbi:hypothetical protein CBM2626_A20074 [Cupriavidus taiwanensis]|uniref:Uncharacterized protein n=1 Tax=Cupriavidus taiwanensis TaxID=164546 RepID=A0A375E5C7_9BURK|nr:hypothetical protein CBM2615_A50049 [Cupriavidus taiwanensis]SOZ59954.1 hypothetical protein CBM2614_A50048 [Cupriavidus taiwanensis]SOZ63021.1 hypothetical protein CBM2613_A40048 [Cupriavidus taiwanensis]SOZ98654.1 hypothetical protein CBM2626_A20074 [Cupriavidus taiwanensis]SPA06426.1 hypothetical protein CBM2625_A40047 [Cupriavidus taiwanensis]
MWQLCNRDERRHLPAGKVSRRIRPKASVPALGDGWLLTSKSKLQSLPKIRQALHRLTYLTLRLGVSKQEMVGIGRCQPRPPPCPNIGRCSLRWSYPDTRVRVARVAVL